MTDKTGAEIKIGDWIIFEIGLAPRNFGRITTFLPDNPEFAIEIDVELQENLYIRRSIVEVEKITIEQAMILILENS